MCPAGPTVNSMQRIGVRGTRCRNQRLRLTSIAATDAARFERSRRHAPGPIVSLPQPGRWEGVPTVAVASPGETRPPAWVGLQDSTGEREILSAVRTLSASR